MSRSPKTSPKPITLALQGGGSHGAMTWGVLGPAAAGRPAGDPGDQRHQRWCDERGRAGRRHGEGGREGARATLARFWKAVSDSARFSPIQRGPIARLTGNYSLDTSPSYLFFEGLTRMFSPYDLNPAGANPLRGLLNDLIDFDRVNAQSDLAVHVTATMCARAAPGLRTRRTGDRGGSGLGLPAADVPGGRDRRRGLLGWGVQRQPRAYPLLTSTVAPDILVVQINPSSAPTCRARPGTS